MHCGLRIFHTLPGFYSKGRWHVDELDVGVICGSVRVVVITVDMDICTFRAIFALAVFGVSHKRCSFSFTDDEEAS